MTASVSNLEDHLGYWLRFVSNHVSDAFRRMVETHGVTVAEWVVLRELWSVDSVNPSQLAEKLGLTRGAISKLVERIVQKGLARRDVGDDDRRFQTVTLLPAGRKLVPVLARLADQNEDEFFGSLPPTDRKRLARLLREMVRQHGWKDVPLQ
jgi:DNA-binding MarR family transcriptional regulator